MSQNVLKTKNNPNYRDVQSVVTLPSMKDPGIEKSNLINVEHFKRKENIKVKPKIYK